MGAVPFYHPQPQDNLAVVRASRYTIPNSVGVIVEDTLIIATLIFGGIMGEFPDLKVCIARSGAPPASAWANWTRVVRCARR